MIMTHFNLKSVSVCLTTSDESKPSWFKQSFKVKMFSLGVHCVTFSRHQVREKEWKAFQVTAKHYWKKKYLPPLPFKQKRLCHSCSASDNFLKCQRNNWLVTFSKVYVYNRPTFYALEQLQNTMLAKKVLFYTMRRNLLNLYVLVSISKNFV